MIPLSAEWWDVPRADTFLPRRSKRGGWFTISTVTCFVYVRGFFISSLKFFFFLVLFLVLDTHSRLKQEVAHLGIVG